MWDWSGFQAMCKTVIWKKIQGTDFFLEVQLKPDARGPVLCFVGPPGVGKTSLASSIAGALGRRFIRLSLGGVKDEADIRGHRRTYIGSMPGRLIDGLKVCNPPPPQMLIAELTFQNASGQHLYPSQYQYRPLRVQYLYSANSTCS